MVPQMRTGLVGEVDDTEAAEHLETVAATMRVFMKDAIRVSGRYAVACGRREVTGEDMKLALMYCARTFFQQRSDDELTTDVQHERALMEEEESESGEEEEDESGEEEESGEEDLTPTPADHQLRRHMETVASVWHRWDPEDPVHVLLKRAIDNTPTSPELEETH